MANLLKQKHSESLLLIVKYLRPYKKDILLLSVFSIFVAITNALVPYLAGRIIDGILKQSDIIKIFSYAIPMAIFFIAAWFFVKALSDVLNWQMTLRKDMFSTAFENNFTIQGVGRLLELPLGFYKKNKTGEIFDKISRAGGQLERMVSATIGLVPQMISILVALFIVFIIKPLLASLLLAAVFIYIFILWKIVPLTALYQRKMHEKYNLAYGHAYDMVLNIQAVKQATAEKHEKREISKIFSKAVDFWNKLWGAWQKANFVQTMLISIVQLLIFSISVFLIWRKEMTIGQLVMFNGYAAMFFAPFVALSQNWQFFQNGLIAVARADKILMLPGENYYPDQAVILRAVNGEVRFDKVDFYYGKKQTKILDNMNFIVKPGEVIALVGESGVGKTTLIDLISLYFHPTRGKILIDGHNIDNLNLLFLRSQIAAVPQEVILFNDSVKNNIRYGNFSANDEKIMNAAKMAHADEFIEKFPKKYEQVVGERGIKLSAGQKQRIAIARAILRDPKILILDEPTSALDAKSEKYVVESLEGLMKNRTTFIIAHRLSTVRKADRIFVLEGGKIIEEGNHDELIKIENGAYRRFYELQKL